MSVITSKLTSKAQTTIPQSVRMALHLEQGDELAYRIEDDKVILTKVIKQRKERQGEDPFRTFSEWNSAADRKAYDNL
jgi:antitoxin PrlF